YSLELYRSRPAETDENLTLHRFPSGTLGFVGKAVDSDQINTEVACCVLPGATLILSGLSEPVQAAFGVVPIEDGVFVKRTSDERHAHKDAVRFLSNGKEVLLQSLNPDIRAQVTGMVPERKAEVADPIETADPVVAISELIG